MKNKNTIRQQALYKILEKGLPQEESEGSDGTSAESEGSAATGAQPSKAAASSKPDANAAGAEPPRLGAVELTRAEVNANLLGTLLQQLIQKQSSGGSQDKQNPSSVNEVEIELPTVAINESPILADGKSLKTWQHPGKEKADRTPCPLNDGKLYKEYSFDLVGFQKWLPRNTRVKAAISIKSTCGNLERLFQMLTFPPDSDPKGVLCQCLTQDLITELRELPIMDKMYSWPKAIIDALDHYLKYLSMKCNQSRPRQEETRKTLLQLSEEIVQGFKGEDHDQRAKQGAAKKRKNTYQMDKQWPPTDLIKSIVKQAMVDLAYVIRYELVATIFLNLDSGLWHLQCGCWILDSGCWILEAGFWIMDLDSGFWIMGSGFWILDSGFWILEFGL